MPLLPEEQESWLALSLVPHVGPMHFTALVKRFGSARAVLEASEKTLLEVPGIGLKTAAAIRRTPVREEAQRQLALLQKGGCELVTLADDTYPYNLKNTSDPPPVLFVRGKLLPQDKQAVAIVGARSQTHYGESLTENLAGELARNGVTVVSGFARGIDAIAHRAALKAGGRTLAVLGCGLDVFYPPEHKQLHNEISAKGAVISEFPFGTPPDPFNFPRRNRIISGLSLGVVVVEAGLKSGALITAEHALEQGRDVFAIPGNVFAKNSQGTNKLIKQGAALVTSVEDVLSQLQGIARSKKSRDTVFPVPEPVDLSPEEQKVFQFLSEEPVHIDLVAQKAEVSVGQALAVLFNLELKGVARQLAGKQFVRQAAPELVP